jgi:ATP-dependent Lon protease
MSLYNRDHNAETDIPNVLPVVPTIDVVVFPHMVVPLLILDEKIIKGVEAALQGSKKILLLAARQQTADYHGPIGIHDLYQMGTVSTIMRVMHLPDGGIKVLTQGMCKAHVTEVLSDQELLQARVNVIVPEEGVQIDTDVIDQHIKNLLAIVERMASSGRMFSPDFQAILAQIQDPERIADFVLSHLNLNVAQAQALLEKENIALLLEGIYNFLHSEYELNSMQERIRSNARDSINKSQREYYLREQLKAIQKELGEEGDIEIDDLKEKVEKLPLSAEARTEVQRQMRRLEKTPPDSMEATVIRNYLEWVVAMPWGHQTKDHASIEHAKAVLDRNHYGLEEVKDRILDFLSVRFLKQDCHTPILCLFGPPGVGKTSLGHSIAECLGRNFFRVSLGGVYDESEIRGHRRTYVGAMPGRFIQAVRKAGSCNPVIVIDEIDKIGMSNRGDPSAALLEVLDPEQNTDFYDNYLGVHFDLSKVMFIATANDLGSIPGPLRDRMEIIQISGYTEEEKLQIAKTHLTPKAIKNCGLEGKSFELCDKTLTMVIRNYTREAGVRDLERNIQKLCSKYARALVETHKNITLTPENLHEYLGPTKVGGETITISNKIGVTNGLAWTPYGGDVLQVEAVLMPGSGKLLMTGQLGDVMKESAQAAMTYAKAHAEVFGLTTKEFSDFDMHIHLPAGAIPKDGPSAGITLLSSILSAYTKRAINGEFAMTGELNLRGEVLPIGGLKEKILAAKQHGLKNIIIPKSNQKDLAGLDKLFEGLQILFVDNVSEVLDHVLMPHAIR